MPLRFKATHSMCDQYLEAAHPCLVGLYSLLIHCRVSSSGVEVGLTWLELFLISIAAASLTRVVVHGTSAQSNKSFANQLREFVSAAH
eukprot:6738670-Karenia_brevis.AAC.1